MTLENHHILIIIPGRLHFTESDALKLFGQCIDEPFDNSEKTKKISIQMMKKYVPMVREALREVNHIQKSKRISRDFRKC